MQAHLPAIVWALQQLMATPGLLQIAIRVAIILVVVWLAFTILKALASFALRIAIIFVAVMLDQHDCRRSNRSQAA